MPSWSYHVCELLRVIEPRTRYAWSWPLWPYLASPWLLERHGSLCGGLYHQTPGRHGDRSGDGCGWGGLQAASGWQLRFAGGLYGWTSEESRWLTYNRAWWGSCDPPVTLRNNLIHCLFSVTMCRESYNKLSVGLLTQTARLAGYIIMDCCRAGDNFTTRFCFVESISLARVNNSNCWNLMLRHYFVGKFYRLSANVDRESCSVCILNHTQVSFSQRVMSVSITFATTVSLSQLYYFVAVDYTVRDNWQVARYIVTPQLTPLEFTNKLQECVPFVTTFACRYLAPVYILGARLSVATLKVERAASPAGRPIGGRCGNCARFSVAADRGESGKHWNASATPIRYQRIRQAVNHLNDHRCLWGGSDP